MPLSISSVVLPEHSDIDNDYIIAETDYFQTLKGFNLKLIALDTHKKLVIMKVKSRKQALIRCDCCGGKIPPLLINSLDCPICNDRSFLTTPSTAAKVAKYFAELDEIMNMIMVKADTLDKISSTVIAQLESKGTIITYKKH